MKPIDVLAVMKADAQAAADYRYQRTREVTAEEYMARLGDSAQARAAVAAALSALAECESYLEAREDVIDGDYGQPAPNKEMTLLREVRAALVLCGAASPETARICATSGP